MEIDDEDKAILFLSLLSISFKNFKNEIPYGKEFIITLDEV